MYQKELSCSKKNSPVVYRVLLKLLAVNIVRHDINIICDNNPEVVCSTSEPQRRAQTPSFHKAALTLGSEKLWLTGVHQNNPFWKSRGLGM